jgi:OHCU decarboxylase
VTKPLDEINKASAAEAESALIDCCGSKRWAFMMALSRPFESEEAMIEKAREIWNDLENSDWLEAFASHPKIGSRKAAERQKVRAAEWSQAEQAGVSDADQTVRDKLEQMNVRYEDRFGYIFIVCASGKSADEMLEICSSRLKNNRKKEILVAAEEQRKITEIRLRKLLGI